MMRLVNRLIALLVIMTPLLARSQQDIPQGTGGANWSVKKIAVEAYGGETVVNLNSGSPKTPGGPLCRQRWSSAAALRAIFL